MINLIDNKFTIYSTYVSFTSKDKSTKVGAVILNPETSKVLSFGSNNFPKGVDDSIKKRYERPEKYNFTVHAEITAIVKAAKEGISINGSHMYVTHFPCAACAGAIINSGITRLVCGRKPDLNDSKWGNQWIDSMIMLKEAGIVIEYDETMSSNTDKI